MSKQERYFEVSKGKCKAICQSTDIKLVWRALGKEIEGWSVEETDPPEPYLVTIERLYK